VREVAVVGRWKRRTDELSMKPARLVEFGRTRLQRKRSRFEGVGSSQIVGHFCEKLRWRVRAELWGVYDSVRLGYKVHRNSKTWKGLERANPVWIHLQMPTLYLNLRTAASFVFVGAVRCALRGFVGCHGCV
jgi:hypothetical protein